MQKVKVSNCYKNIHNQIVDNQTDCLNSYVNFDDRNSDDKRNETDNRTGEENCVWITNWPSDFWSDKTGGLKSPHPNGGMCYLKSTLEGQPGSTWTGNGYIGKQNGKVIEKNNASKMLGDTLTCNDGGVCEQSESPVSIKYAQRTTGYPYETNFYANGTEIQNECEVKNQTMIDKSLEFIDTEEECKEALQSLKLYEENKWEGSKPAWGPRGCVYRGNSSYFNILDPIFFDTGGQNKCRNANGQCGVYECIVRQISG